MNHATDFSAWPPLEIPNTSFQRTLTRGGLLAPYGAVTHPASEQAIADLRPPFLLSRRLHIAAGGEFGPLNSNR